MPFGNDIRRFPLRHVVERDRCHVADGRGGARMREKNSDDPNVPVPGECPGLALVRRDMGRGNWELKPVRCQLPLLAFVAPGTLGKSFRSALKVVSYTGYRL